MKMFMQNVHEIWQDYINLWESDGVLVIPKGIPLYSQKPKGPLVKAARGLVSLQHPGLFSDLMKSTDVDESLAVFNQMFCYKRNHPL